MCSVRGVMQPDAGVGSSTEHDSDGHREPGTYDPRPSDHRDAGERLEHDQPGDTDDAEDADTEALGRRRTPKERRPDTPGEPDECNYGRARGGIRSGACSHADGI